MEEPKRDPGEHPGRTQEEPRRKPDVGENQTAQKQTGAIQNTGAAGGRCPVGEAATRLLRFTTWNPLEPAVEPAQFGGYALRVWYGFISWSPLEPAGTRGGTRAFSRTLYAEIQIHVSPRDLFILLN